MGGEKDKTAQNLPLPEFCRQKDWGGGGAYLQLGGQEEVRTIPGRGTPPRVKLLCLPPTTCQVQPHSADGEMEAQAGGKRPSGLVIHTWPLTSERAGQKFHTRSKTDTNTHSCLTHLDLDSFPFHGPPHCSQLSSSKAKTGPASVTAQSPVPGTHRDTQYTDMK